MNASSSGPAGFLDRRRCGVLLHPTSLPGAGPRGELDPAAFHFVDFLIASRASVWQVLPLAPTHADLSPYRAQSVHAGDPALISLTSLQAGGLLEVIPTATSGEGRAQLRQRCLRAAFHAFSSRHDECSAGFEKFRHTHAHWLPDYCLYQALRERYRHQPWWHWPEALRDRDPVAIRRAGDELAAETGFQAFLQYLFREQWSAVKRYANERGVLLFGDMPLFVAHDSADVWARRECFRLDALGMPETITGVPPDYFSATGQRWGNPHYHWQHLEEDGFGWWVERLHSQLELYDLVRIDHFRGLQAAWEIDPKADTAVEGQWVEAPGAALLEVLRAEAGGLPLVAEDLGMITPEVHALRDAFGLPGMGILQFAFDGGPENPYLPHNHVRNSVVYTGTHDNTTTLGWWQDLDPHGRGKVRDYLGCVDEEVVDRLYRMRRSWTACTAVYWARWLSSPYCRCRICSICRRTSV